MYFSVVVKYALVYITQLVNLREKHSCPHQRRQIGMGRQRSNSVQRCIIFEITYAGILLAMWRGICSSLMHMALRQQLKLWLAFVSV